ncbi:Wzy polymerase domain-containing protein [Rhodoferax sp.]|uniref:PglL family O-oligosaccharyltransferase n=1 Tax=Rhodoferax sp. TaxID=50421 RepID=UPI00261380CC|nr:Wzy polymerase domain-containing protein [Rhodoferax sp.]MDD2809425.1 Wzy polymerase domain-containing protein [Rhodoferax sp.]
MPLLFSWLCLSLVCLGWLGRSHTTSPRLVLFAFIASWLMAGMFNAAIGLAQYFNATDWAGRWINHPHPGEAFGNLRQRNQFATLLNIGITSVVWIHWRVNYLKQIDMAANWFLRNLLTILCIAFLAIANSASSSRTGFFQLITLLGLAIGWQRQMTSFEKKQLKAKSLSPVDMLLIALVLYTTSSFALPWLAGLDPFSNGTFSRLRAGDSLCASRTTLWSNVLHLISLHPWTGWGWGELDFAHFITLYPTTRFCDILDNAHNLPLQLAVELGVPAAVLVCSAALWAVWRCKPWHETRPSHQLAWSVLAVIGLHSLLEYPLWYGPFQITALACISIIYSDFLQAKFKSCQPSTKQQLRYFAMALCGLTLTWCAIAAWNYHLASQIYLPQSERMSAYRQNTLDKLSELPMFQDQVQFAKLTTTELTVANAQEVHQLAQAMLHFSPEARVVEILIESCKLLGKTDEVHFYAARYQAAFPLDYANWLNRNTNALTPN